MKLSKFKIHNFRSVQDTHWIEASQLTCLVGKNEAGKTNFLLPLYKFNPATENSLSEIKTQKDYPKSKYSDFESDEDLALQPFISVLFNLNNTDIQNINQKISNFNQEIEENPEGESKKIECSFSKDDLLLVSRDWMDNFYFYKSNDEGEKQSRDIGSPDLVGEDVLIEFLPKFIYFSEYGNLESSIHLPTIINQINDQNFLTEKEKQKVRTAKTLFDFASLDLNKLNSLGQNDNVESKKERQNLINSASRNLTNEFNKWWRDDNYKFRLSLDGNHFWIYVSDDKREDEIEFELRSRGLQWFFSFYLVFSVESDKEHKDCILLLDEPGLTLHPNKQKDLIHFFNTLSEINQLFYTTHLPFLVDHNNINRIVGVFVDKKGVSKATNDLTKIDKGDSSKSIQPVNAAIGISASESLLYNCQIVIVEGISDQFYLSIVKSYLISEGLIKPKKELVFLPVKGTKSIPSTVSIIQGSKFELPYVIVDSDEQGKKRAEDLKNGFYHKEKNKIIEIKDITKVDDSEVEDLFSKELLTKYFGNLVNKVSDDYDDYDFNFDDTKPITKEMTKFIAKNELKEKLRGWKTEISKKFKENFEKEIKETSEQIINLWKKLFEKII